jgi:hypothetical protein
VKIVRLDDSDEGDVDDGAIEADDTDDVIVDAEAQKIEEDAVEDAWSEDALSANAGAPPLSHSETAPPSSPDAGPQNSEPPPTHEATATAEMAAAVDRLTQHTLKMAQVLKLEHNTTEAALRDIVTTLLQKVSPERLLLALCYSENVADLLDATEFAPNQPVARDDAGIAEIANGLSKMGAKVARKRGALGSNETVDRRQIENMVRAEWNRKPNATPAEMVQDMTALFGQTFMTVEPRRLRNLLGLPGKPPASTAQPPTNGVEQPAGTNGMQRGSDTTLEGLARARQAWSKDRLDAIAGIGALRDAIRQEFAADDEQATELAAAMARLEDLVGQLDDGLDRTLDTVVNEADAEQRLRLRPAAMATLDRMDAFVSENELMTELDGNEILPDMKIVAPLKSRLAEVRAALS